MNVFLREFAMAARQSPRLFFAPIVGAVDAVRRELARMNSSVGPLDSCDLRRSQIQVDAE